MFIFVLISIYISNQLRDAFMPPLCKKTLCVWVLRRILVFVSKKLIVIDWYHLKFFNNEYLLLSIFVKSSSKPYMYSSERVCTLCMIKLIISISLYFFTMAFVLKKNPKQFLFHAVVNSLFCCYAQGTYITVCMILLCALLIIYTCYMNVYIYLLFYIPSLNNKHGWLVVLSFNTTHH